MSSAGHGRDRAMITVCAIGATLPQSLDQTIATVALPYRPARLSASYDEITWVLTWHRTAAAIITAQRCPADRPLSPPTLFRDKNFLSGLVLMFAVGTLLVSSLALMTPWLQGLNNHPMETAGMIMARRSACR